jgi:hypothetical protein
LHLGPACWFLRAAVNRGNHPRRIALTLELKQLNNRIALAIFGRQPARNEERSGEKENYEQNDYPDSRKNHDPEG